MRCKHQIRRLDGRRFRSLLTAIVLVAFSLQSFLIQTHVHALAIAPHQSAVTGVNAPQNSHTPLDIDNCVLCQEYVHGGTYLTPSGLAVLPPSAHLSLVPFVIAPAAVAKAISHIWMGRAPPRA